MSNVSVERQALEEHLGTCYDEVVDERLEAVQAHLAPFCEGDISFAVTDLIAEERHTLVVRGAASRDGGRVGELTIRYMPDIGHIVMCGLQVEHVDRGQGIAATFSLRLLYSARALGYERILIDAGPTMGRAIWARYGFSFASARSQGAVRAWFEESLPRLGVSVGTLDDAESPADFYMIGAGEQLGLTLGEVADQVDYAGLDRDAIVAANASAEDLHVGQVLMLFGPDWAGTLRVDSSAATRFEAACRRRLRAIGAQVPEDFGR